MKSNPEECSDLYTSSARLLITRPSPHHSRSVPHSIHSELQVGWFVFFLGGGWAIRREGRVRRVDGNDMGDDLLCLKGKVV